MQHLKILVTGPYKSGKSKMVEKLSTGKSINIENSGTTIGLDYGSRDYDDLKMHFFGTPGQEHLSIVSEVLADGADGAIVVVDSSNQESIDKVRSIFSKLGCGNMPCVIAANKQDVSGALSPEQIHAIIDMPEIPVHPTSAETGEGVDGLLNKLVSRLRAKALEKRKQLQVEL